MKTPGLIIKKISKMLLTILSVLVVCFILLIVFVWINSTGKPEPFLDEKGKLIEGSISEKTFVQINGIKQGMFIRSKNINNPVLLYVHGGPAFPNYFLIDKYKPGLEEYFTVCYWEQRGGGLSYCKEVTIESMNFDQLASDAIQVTNYLRKRFGKQKIYLMAHSGGTPLAIMAAAKAPQLYYCYVGIAQISNQKESEKLAYSFMLNQYRAQANMEALKKLDKFPVLESDTNIVPFYKSIVRDESMHELGIGTMRNMKSVFNGVFVPVWMCNAYTMNEKFNIWKSKFSFIKKTNLINELFNTDLTTKITKLDIPVYFFSGKYDLTVNHDLSKAYLEKIQAPVKGFYTFENSAHSPVFEEPKRFRDIIAKDIINGTTILADIK